MKKLFKTIFLGIALLLSSAQQTNARTFRIEIVGDRTNVYVEILDEQEQDRPLARYKFDKNQCLIKETIINMIAKVLIANTTKALLPDEELVNISNQIVQLCEQNLVQEHQFLSGAVILFAGALFTPTLFLTIPGVCYLKYLRYNRSTHIFELNVEENTYTEEEFFAPELENDMEEVPWNPICITLEQHNQILEQQRLLKLQQQQVIQQQIPHMQTGYNREEIANSSGPQQSLLCGHHDQSKQNSEQFNQEILRRKIEIYNANFRNFSEETKNVLAQQIVDHFRNYWQTKNALHSVGITTIGHLSIAYNLFGSNLQQIKGIGPTGMQKIIEVLKYLNLIQ